MSRITHWVQASSRLTVIVATLVVTSRAGAQEGGVPDPEVMKVICPPIAIRVDRLTSTFTKPIDRATRDANGKKVKVSDASGEPTNVLEKRRDLCIEGKLYVNGTFIGYTLEHGDLLNAKDVSAIPVGSYPASIRKGGDMGFRIQLARVPERGKSAPIQIHRGNEIGDSTGCLLVGTGVNLDRCELVNATGAQATLQRAVSDQLAACPNSSISVQVGGDPGLPQDQTCEGIERTALAAERAKRVEADKLWEEAQQLRKAGPDFRQNDKDFAQAVADWVRFETKASNKLDELAQKVADLVAEEEEALKELREGRFCSKCHRTATEIEHDEHVSFQDHLGTVQGQEVPATPEEIAAKAAEFDEKIAAAKKELDDGKKDLHDREKDLLKDLAALQDGRNKIFAAYVAKIEELEENGRAILRAANVQYQKDHKKAEDCRHAG